MNRNMGLKKCLIAVAVLLLGAGVAASVQGATLLHNGDFEDNTAIGSQYNLTNAAFSSAMAYATAFSTNYEELDILTSGNAIGIIAPQSGSWMVGLHQNTADPNYIDAFSLALISPIVAGRTYELDFYAVGYSIGTLGPVEIGLTDSPTAFGTSIYTATPAGTGSWSHFAHSFEAPVNADYLTVRVTPDSGTYVAVDNFMLTPEPGTLGLLLIGGLALLRRRRA